MKLVNTYSDPNKSVSTKVYYNNNTAEYIVEFYKNGVHISKANYFTDDKADAISTAKYAVDNSPKQSNRL